MFLPIKNLDYIINSFPAIDLSSISSFEHACLLLIINIYFIIMLLAIVTLMSKSLKFIFRKF